MNVAIIVMDSVRAADVDETTMPTLSSMTSRTALAPSSWTLPTHASLYSLKSPIAHETTRPTDRLTDHAFVDAIRAAGFTVGGFSENPYFSARFGFAEPIDYFDDDIHHKPRRSGYSFKRLVEREPSRPKRYVRAAHHLLHSNERVADLHNGIRFVRGTDDRRRQFYGDRVLSHARDWLSTGSEDSVAIINLLDAHQPHVPTKYSDALGYDFSEPEIRALDRFDGMEFLSGQRIDDCDHLAPFDTWDELFERLHAAYRTQIRYLDDIVSEFIRSCDDVVPIVTSDHGQMLGEEGWFDHHGVLHPKAVEVPFFVGEGAESELTGETVHGLVAEVFAHLTDGVTPVIGSGETLVASDGIARQVDSGWTLDEGPTSRLSTDDLLCRRVARPSDSLTTIFESPWSSSEIHVKQYERSGEAGRQLVDRCPYDGQLEASVASWLRASPEAYGSIDSTTADRLDRLGYL
ncbi:sulfatase-like hydrolase/transferase [Halococcoides cellulosivorans]|uniref:Sulfatase N-terminal domain-containing protein n=1 Tax=Halococcoides cellulosivorans TaxID=1679096 RepID=A0A2R4WXZ8_9EURY|nr:sulfatase-like hydrolase/transferase [Halococcoides cellulosivorans]AWB26406.1 hypothetical protein HARCEL1_01045 [Halococcoides cellulosivorans]